MRSKKILSAEEQQKIATVLREVYAALDEKGYDATAQIWGYIQTQDPTYITFYQEARQKITSLDREDIGRFLLDNFFNK